MLLPVLYRRILFGFSASDKRRGILAQTFRRKKLALSIVNANLIAFLRKVARDGRIADVVNPLLLLAAFGYFYSHQIRFAWTRDDGALLLLAALYKPSQYFFDVGFVHGVSPSNFYTPWLILNYDLNAWLFGDHVNGYYWHQLVSMAIAVALSYRAMRLFVMPGAALIGSAIFAWGVPVLFATQELMVIHYVEGLCFAQIAVIGSAIWLQRGLRWWLWIALTFYLASLFCKEVYFPLPALLFALPFGDFKRRLHLAGYLAVIGLLYLAWRYYALGAIADGHSGQLEISTMARNLFIASRVVELFWGPQLGPVYGFVLGASIAFAVFRQQRNWPMLGFVLGCLVAGSVPLLPLQPSSLAAPNRLVFFAWWLTALVLVTTVCALFKHRPTHTALLLVLFVLFEFHNVKARAEFAAQRDADLVNRLYAELASSKASDSFALDSLERSYLSNVLNGFQRTYRLRGWHGANGLLVPIEDLAAEQPLLPRAAILAGPRPEVNAELAAKRAALCTEAIAATFEFDSLRQLVYWRGQASTNGVLKVMFKISEENWQVKGASMPNGFGPLGRDYWHFRAKPGMGSKIFWPNQNMDFEFRVWFKSDGGCLTASPPLRFSPASQPVFSWRSN